MQFGINANLVRTWIGKERGAGGMRVVDPVKRSDAGAFMPIQLEAAKAEPIGEAASMLRLHVRLPNGVEFDLGEARLDELSSVMRILGDMSCSGSTSR